MPIQDGYEFTKHIHLLQDGLRHGMQKNHLFYKAKTRFECPVVAVTAFHDDETKEKVRLAGMRCMLQKPVNYNDL